MSAPGHGPVGQYFLTLDDERNLDFHGQIIGCPEPGFYIAQFFSAFTNAPTNCEIRQLAQMADWKFYPSTEQLLLACRHYNAGER
jgi:hypothetical protein